MPLCSGILEYYAAAFDEMWGKIYNEFLEVKDGYAIAPDRPGIGFTPNEKALAEYKDI